MKKMPLGKLSRRQIESAYSVLSELQREIVGTQNPSKILDSYNKLLVLIVADFDVKASLSNKSEQKLRSLNLHVGS